jgi:hypothetical protein
VGDYTSFPLHPQLTSLLLPLLSSPLLLLQMMFGCGISDDPSFDTFLSDLVRTPITTAYKMAGELILCCAVVCCAVLPCLALLSALFCLNLILYSLFSSLFSPS